ncbi:MAG: tRNA (adenosine(37)-N6)-threonylcarbamoyltransferase complex transferase subunit TsaD [Rhodospirillaceae bacterium]|nr:tRNA (adenosine(37)-N6)-threonylcarbamoyltransferase complex transferase subunit TsaD [Rhodospirillaceae bacterium]
MIVLGIETSCDETAAAIVNGQTILSNLVYSQIAEHGPYGGVVPEIAARSHVHHLDILIKEAMREAHVGFKQIDGVAATAGPGLIGGLMVGLTMGKAIALVHNLPFVAANHLEAHALSARLTHSTDFPYLLLLASGGHCQFLVVNGVSNYQRLGTTLDDAPGEAFDKVARMLGLGYPGGPAIEEQALEGDPKRYQLPRPLKGRKGCDFSFSGLKTAVANIIAKHGEDNDFLSDLCASFQEAIADVFVDRLESAQALINQPEGMPISSLVLAGGVGANKCIRDRLSKRATQLGLNFIVPPANLCTDNAAMVAWVGYESISLGLVDSMHTPARARWPLEPIPHVCVAKNGNGCGE